MKPLNLVLLTGAVTIVGSVFSSVFFSAEKNAQPRASVEAGVTSKSRVSNSQIVASNSNTADYKYRNNHICNDYSEPEIISMSPHEAAGYYCLVRYNASALSERIVYLTQQENYVRDRSGRLDNSRDKSLHSIVLGNCQEQLDLLNVRSDRAHFHGEDCMNGALRLSESQYLQRKEAINEYLNDGSDRYVINEDNTVTDSHTGLTWMRCSIGQVWDGKTCVGDALALTFNQAMNFVEKTNEYESHESAGEWILPTKSQLYSLVYCSSGRSEPYKEDVFSGVCKGGYISPTIRQEIFPNTENGLYWTSTADEGSRGYVRFFNGLAMFSSDSGRTMYARLVKLNAP